MVSFEPVKNNTCTFQGHKIEIVPYIPEEVISEVISAYLALYFDGGQWDYLKAEKFMVLYLLDNLTSINVIEDGMVVVSYDDLISSGLWDLVSSVFVNYREFRIALERAVADHKEQIRNASQLGSRLERLMDFVENMDVEKLSETVQESIKQIKESNIAPILMEASQDVKDKKSRTRKAKEK